MFTRSAFVVLALAASTLAAEPPLPEGAIARLGSPQWRNLTDGRSNLAFSPDGSAVITQASDVIRMIDFKTGRERWRIQDFRGDAAFVPLSEKRLLVGQNRALRIIDLDSGKDLLRVAISLPVNEAVVSDGKLAAVHDMFSADDGALAIFDLATGVKLWHHGGLNQGFSCFPIGFVPGKSELVARVPRNQNTLIRVLDTSTQKAIREWTLPKTVSSYPWPVVLSPDGKLIWSAGYKEVRIWNVASGKEELVLTGHASVVVQAAFFSDGKRLITSSHDRTLRWWDLTTGKELGKIESGKIVDRLAVSPDGERVAAACRGSNVLHRFDLETGRELTLPDGHTDRIEQLAFLPDKKSLLTASLDGTVRVWDLPSRKTSQSWKPAHQRLNWLAVSDDGKMAATAGIDDAVIRLWETSSGKEIRSITAPGRVIGCIAFAPGSTTLVSGGSGGFGLWDALTGKQIKQIPFQLGGPSGISFTFDRQHIVSAPQSNSPMGGGASTTAQIVNLETGRLQSLEGRFDYFAIASPDGTSIAVIRQGSDKPELVLVEMAGGKERLNFDYGPGAGQPLAFSPDGRMLVCPGSYSHSGPRRDPRVILFDTATGKEIRRLDSGEVSSFGFSPDGKTLATGGIDGTVLLWDMSKIRAYQPTGKLNAEKLWDDLADDAPAAYQAVITIGRAGEPAVKLLRDRIKPAPPLDQKRLAQLLDDLEDAQFAVRQKAGNELAALGENAGDALRDRLKTTASAEARKSISLLLEKLDGWLTHPQALREIRAVEALERNDSPAARQLLEELAKGDASARLTREARAALSWKDRLAKLREK